MILHRLTRDALARRVREIRRELYGESGGPALAASLGLPAETWANYEGAARRSRPR